MRGNRSKLEDLLFMYGVWKDSYYDVNDIAFCIRAVSLARLECQIYHIEQMEEERHVNNEIVREEELV